jgi:hypothetical protein
MTGGADGSPGAGAPSRRHAHLTHTENRDAGRHGWLRLTPAYSYRLVAETLANRLDDDPVVLDPFSGSGTTGLVAAEHGLRAHLVDVNPFLVWLAGAKTRTYDLADLDRAREVGHAMASQGPDLDTAGLWAPALHRIDRWWRPAELDALKRLRHVLDEVEEAEPVTDLLRVVLCRTLIAVSNAAFDHQSMSFAADADGEASSASDGRGARAAATWGVWAEELERLLASARQDLDGTVTVHLGDARDLAASVDAPVDLLYTSPPYANRMSYVRELRPYMYWLRYLTQPADAGELDWSAIGGTWGVATSRVAGWEAERELPLGRELMVTCDAIRASGGRNADLLARYVHKYTEDMWRHFRSAAEVLRPGGRAIYVVGNSTFFGKVVPVQDWYARLLTEAGFRDVAVRTIRKRNSNKALYEYAVEATRG